MGVRAIGNNLAVDLPSGDVSFTPITDAFAPVENLESVKPRIDKTLSELRYKDTLASFLGNFGTAQINGTEIPQTGTIEFQKKNLNQGPSQDVIVPFSAPFDPVDYAGKTHDQLKIAQKEEPKAIIPPMIPMPLDVKVDSVSSEKLIVKAVEASAEVQKKPGFFTRFVSWISGLFGKKNKKVAEGDEQGTMALRNKLESPEKKNAEAIRDCLKRLNESVEKMRELVENEGPTGANVDAETAMLFHFLIEAMKKHCEHKKHALASINSQLSDSQQKLKEYHAKYFEALNSKSSLKWLSKGGAALGVASAGIAIGGLGFAAVMVAATIATGGVAAVAAAFGTIAACFAVPQAISAGLKGVSTIIKAGTDFKVDSHQGDMTKYRALTDATQLENQQHFKDLTELLNSINKTWELLSKISTEQASTTASFIQ